MLAGMMKLPDAPLRELIAAACPDTAAMAAMRSVSRHWRATMRQVLALSPLHDGANTRAQLGCALWDGQLRLKAARVEHPDRFFASEGLACVCWAPRGESLLCLYWDEDGMSIEPPTFALFDAASGEVRSQWAIGNFEKLWPFTEGFKGCVSISFADAATCLAVFVKSRVLVLTYDLQGVLHRSFTHELHRWGRVTGLNPAVFSFDGQHCAVNYHVDFGEDPTVEDGIDPGVYLDYISAFDISAGRQAWRTDDLHDSADSIAFVKCGLLVNEHSRVRLLDIQTGSILSILGPFSARPFGPFCISPNGEMLAERQFVYRLVEDAQGGYSVRTVCRIPDQVPARGNSQSRFAAWTPDGTKVAFMHERSDNAAVLDIIDAADGSLVWRRRCGFGCGTFNDGFLGFSPDGARLAAWQPGTAAVHVLAPAVLSF